MSLQIDFGGRGTGRVAGIDLGTTNSLIAVMDGARPRVIPGADGRPLVPSVVSAAPAGGMVVGEAARALLIDAPECTAYSIKRLMGKGAADVAELSALFPFRIEEGSESVVRIRLGGRTLTPPEISAAILRQLKANAEAHLGEPVSQAVITVPAYFNDAQRQATRDAGRIAGLEVLRLVNEPTAAALAYGLDKRREGIVAVYDLGGGTFDISILELHDGIFKVLATNGDTSLGGDDIDNRLIRIALEEIAVEWGEDFSHSGEAVQLLRRAAIEAKERLSFAPHAEIVLEYRGRRYERSVSRESFERLVADIVDRTMGPCRDCIRDAGVAVERIDEVVLVGGSTRIPMVRDAVAALFRAQPHSELNPEEVVALGAAVEAGILAGSVEGKLLLDVTPLSLGIETMGGVVSKLIHRNTTIPASATETFTTAVEGQANVLIHVLQGERELVRDCRSLARFDLKGIEPMPAGLPRIEVRFLIDASGILNVTALDARTGRQQSVEVKPTYGLTGEQVEAMIAESIEHAGEDFEARQVREAQVDADAILTAVDQAKRDEAWGVLPAEERQTITAAVNHLLLAYHSGDHLLVREKIDWLNAATAGLAAQMMRRAAHKARAAPDSREVL
jgi:Fe-S protein assembly chaperone HscA